MASTCPGMSDTHELDARGLLCPLPVLKAAKRLRGLAPGDVLHVLTDDPAAVIDVPHFCNESGHRLIASEERPDGHAFRIERV